MPSTTPSLDLTTDVTTLTAAVCDVESVSLGEAALADALEAAAAGPAAPRRHPHRQHGRGPHRPRSRRTGGARGAHRHRAADDRPGEPADPPRRRTGRRGAVGPRDRRHEGRCRRDAPHRAGGARAQPRRDLRVLRGRGDRLAVQRAAPRRGAAPRPHRRRRLRRAPRAHRRARRGRVQGHPARRGLHQGHRLPLGTAVEGAQRHPRRRRGPRPARRVRAGDARGRRARVPRGAQRRARLRRHGEQRHPRPLRRHGQLPLRPLGVRGGGRRPRARGLLRASRSTSSTTRAGPGRACTCPPHGRSSRRSGCRSRPSRAGPTSPASRPSAFRR